MKANITNNKGNKDGEETGVQLSCPIPIKECECVPLTETVDTDDVMAQGPVPTVPALEVKFICCPFGCWTALPLTLGYLAAIFSAFSIFTCYLVGDPFILFGYRCLRFVPASSYSHEDTPFRYGRIASFLGAIGGLVYTGLITALISCRAISKLTSLVIGSGFGVLSILCFSALVARTTDACEYVNSSLGPSKCIFGPGMGMSVAAGTFFFLAAVSMCRVAVTTGVKARNDLLGNKHQEERHHH